ncbi:MAG: HRDC domain-containing protein, partial [Chloroflexi bacterium]|nr:HRDC domain-containing protein [Chloroflexota bacterium]
GFHRSPERICLIQLATPDSVYLIDPLEIDDPSPLGELLADASVEKVLHSADYDVRSLDRDWGFRIRNLFDTSIAAAFVGSTMLGLGAVLQEFLKVEVNKSKKLQRADWTLRPLRPDAQHYAAGDVLHLERVRDLLVARLSALSRLEWVAEECERLADVRYRPPDYEWGFASVKGSRTLDGRGLAVLRSLHQFRENEAVKRDRPPFKVLPDAALLTLAASPDADLPRVKGLGRFGHPPASNGLEAAIRDGLRDGPISRPRSTGAGPRLSPTERAKAQDRLQRLKGWRTGLGRRLGLDPALLWPAVSLTRIASSRDGLDAEFTSAEVRSWQRREFGDSLRSFVETQLTTLR